MRVLYVTSSLDRQGGVARSLAETLPRLQEAGVDVVCACFTRVPTGFEDDLADAGIDVRILGIASLAAGARKVRRLIRTERPDLVHTLRYSGTQVGRLAAWRTGVPVVTSITNLVHDPAQLAESHVPAWRRHLLWSFDAWTARHLTAHLHAVTEAVKASAVAGLRVPEARVTVIRRSREPGRLGEPSATRRAAARSALALPPDAPVLLNVGRLDSQKGQTDLVDAFAAVRAHHPDAVLLVAGRPGGASAAVARRVAAHGLEPHVRLLGHRDDVPELLAAADVFVFPSLYEGTAGAVIEALALGVPVVTSALETLEEVAGDAALYAPVHDPAAIASAVLRVLGDAELAARLGARGRDRYRERFGPEEHTEGMLALYREVLGRRS